MRFFSKLITGVGIDISEHHIRLARVSIFGVVKELIEIEIPDGLIVDEKVEKLKEVQSLFQKEFNSASLKDAPLRATILLPESRVFFHSFIAGKELKGEKLKEKSLSIAQREIPILFSHAETAISQGSQEAEGVRTTVYAVDSDVADGFREIVSVTPFKVIATETNSKAILRFINKYRTKEHLPTKPTDLIALVDVGHTWISVTVYTLKGSNVYSRSNSFKQLGVKTVNRKLPIKGIETSIIETIKEILVYFNNHEQAITSVYISGLDLLDKQAVSEINKIIGKDSSVFKLGDAFSIKGLDDKKIQTFGPAIGAALRSAVPWKYTYQHNFLNNKKLK
jgi:hypothetical protein